MSINPTKFILKILAASFCLGNIAQAELNHFEEVRRLLEEEAVFLNTSLGLNIFGCGGLFVEDISALELIVEVPGRLELRKARMIFTAALQDWINRVNADKAARPYFKTFPMTVDNFELRMILQEYDLKSDETDPIPAFIFNVGDKIVYCYRRESGALTPFLRESFTEVLAEISRQKALRRR